MNYAMAGQSMWITLGKMCEPIVQSFICYAQDSYDTRPIRLVVKRPCGNHNGDTRKFRASNLQSAAKGFGLASAGESPGMTAITGASWSSQHPPRRKASERKPALAKRLMPWRRGETPDGTPFS